ncbi:MAG TPA: enolase C-terminal domain-like protein, partial [Candidatus Bathyarchaeia archaeon]|nr:enolase C-terminal domain-like protein [Candidatus Bathyarchaeia archaeon]
AKQIEKYDVEYLEEPCLYYDLEALANVVAKSTVPIGAGEHAHTVHGFRDLIRARAADIFNPDVTVAGGIRETKNICTIADAWGIPVIPHCGGLSAIGLAANLHLCASAINCIKLEYDTKPWQPMRDELITEPIFSLDQVKEGRIKVPTKPGLGIEINEDAFARYPYIKQDLEPDLPNYGVGRL